MRLTGCQASQVKCVLSVQCLPWTPVFEHLVSSCVLAAEWDLPGGYESLGWAYLSPISCLCFWLWTRGDQPPQHSYYHACCDKLCPLKLWSPKYLPPWDVRYQTTVPRPVVRMLGPASLVWWNTPGDFCLSGETFSPWGNGSLLCFHLFYWDFLADWMSLWQNEVCKSKSYQLWWHCWVFERTWRGCLRWLGSALCSWLPGNNKHFALQAMGRGSRSSLLGGCSSVCFPP